MFGRKRKENEGSIVDATPFRENLVMWSLINENLKDPNLDDETREQLMADGKELQGKLMKQIGKGALKLVAIAGIVIVITVGGLLVLGSIGNDDEAEESEDVSESEAVEDPVI